MSSKPLTSLLREDSLKVRESSFSTGFSTIDYSRPSKRTILFGLVDWPKCL